jgi:heparan-alpha-glucosaminide N-acetyltransferase
MNPIPTEMHPSASKSLSQRIDSIDILRAITMVLMIFVNDFFTLTNIPDWLKHAPRGVDGIGFSDVIFPAFLFIVGLSLPYAIEHRRLKGESNTKILKHVLFRTLALLTMGVFLVNGETINNEASGIKTGTWFPMVCLCFILIWNKYSSKTSALLQSILQYSAILSLLILAFFYRGGENGDIRFETHWWGILGLIGWAYLASALITVFAKNNGYVLFLGWIFFCALSILNKADLFPNPAFFHYIPGTIKSGTLVALTMGGVLSSFIFRHYVEKNANLKLSLYFGIASIGLIILSIITRPYWGLAKLGATPAWLFLCSAITLISFTLIYWIVDVWKKAKIFNFIKAAGTDTLLCYLIPYFFYGMYELTDFKLPEIFTIGGIGLLKSLIFALLCVFITKRLNNSGVRLKI